MYPLQLIMLTQLDLLTRTHLFAFHISQNSSCMNSVLHSFTITITFLSEGPSEQRTTEEHEYWRESSLASLLTLLINM